MYHSSLIIRKLFESLARNITDKTLEKYSYRNFHTPGVDYISLGRVPGASAKLYVFHHDKLVRKFGRYVVSPHTHGYDFFSYVLEGSMQNVVFKRVEGDECFEHKYRSPLKYKDATVQPFELAGKCSLRSDYIDTCRVGQGYFLDRTQIHSIIVPPREEPTVLALLQLEDAGLPYTSFFTRDETTPEIRADNTYEHFPAQDARTLLRWIFPEIDQKTGR